MPWLYGNWIESFVIGMHLAVMHDRWVAYAAPAYMSVCTAGNHVFQEKYTKIYGPIWKASPGQQGPKPLCLRGRCSTACSTACCCGAAAHDRFKCGPESCPACSAGVSLALRSVCQSQSLSGELRPHSKHAQPHDLRAACRPLSASACMQAVTTQ